MEDSAVFSLKTDVTGVGGDGDDSAIEFDTEELFEVVLGFDEVVLVHLKESVVDGVAEIALAPVGEGNEISKGLDVLVVISGGDERDEGAKEIGDGNDVVTLVGSDDAGFTTGVHAGSNTREIIEAGQKKTLSNDWGAGAATNGDYSWHVSRY